MNKAIKDQLLPYGKAEDNLSLSF